MREGVVFYVQEEEDPNPMRIEAKRAESLFLGVKLKQDDVWSDLEGNRKLLLGRPKEVGHHSASPEYMSVLWTLISLVL